VRSIGAFSLAVLLATIGCGGGTSTMWEGRHWAQPGVRPWPLTIWVHGDVKDVAGYRPIDRFARAVHDEFVERGFVPRMTVSTLPPPPPPMLELHVVRWALPSDAAAAVAVVSPISSSTEIVVECKTHTVPGNPFDFRGAVYGYASIGSADPGLAADAAGRAVAEEIASGGSATYRDRPYVGLGQ
jgi:hypothetical protein